MNKIYKSLFKISITLCMFLPNLLWANGGTLINSGDTAWMLTSTALVLLMTIPGLAFFYGGLVRIENVLAVFMQAFITCCIVSIFWVVCGYSLVFTEGNAFIGSLDKLYLNGVNLNSVKGTIPESVLIAFQMTFAIITPALMLGAVADRIKLSSTILITALWSILVYCPIAHWLWGPKGLLDGTGVENYTGLLNFGPAIDFAGGMVVHISSGISALVLCLVIGPRNNQNKANTRPYSLAFSIIGACLLWVGWFGFNAGSAVAANGNAGLALLVTHTSCASAAIIWMLIEWKVKGKPSIVGIITGAVAGLVTVTPASGYINVGSALAFGAISGAACFWAINYLKKKLGYDDSLDAFGVHGVGGVIGSILTGVFANKSVGGISGLIEGNSDLLFAQIIGVIITVAYSGAVTFVILKLIKCFTDPRVDEQTELQGLDKGLHGETL
ncbi:MAG: ammonium transporter [Alphaproteobacteria bacterium]